MSQQSNREQFGRNKQNIDTNQQTALMKQSSLKSHQKEDVSPRNKNDMNEWQTVSRKSRLKKSNEIICTGIKKTTTSLISGAPKKRWVYVGRIAGRDISDELVKQYIGESIEQNIEVKKLETKGNNSAFSIGVDTDDFYGKICDPEFWPQRVIVRNFSIGNLFRLKPATT